MIKVEKLTKYFGSFCAVDDVSFTVKKGEVLGFLGPNGAGKSTTMKMLTGFLEPTSGEASICGHSIISDPLHVKSSVGYLPEGAPAYGDMTASAFLGFIADVRGFKGAEKAEKIAVAIQRTNLQSMLHKPIETLSKGFKRRVGLAQAILHEPPVLIMDEPTDGLDPNQKHEVRQLLKTMAQDKAIIISTHILEEVHAICTRAIIIANGKLLFDGTPDELEAKSAFHNALSLTMKTTSASEIQSALKSLSNVAKVEQTTLSDQRTNFTIYSSKGASILIPVNQLLRDRQWAFDELSVQSGHLDDVFRAITTQGKQNTSGVLS